ncbi:hypothetical protein LTR78_002118 [Recurvomyces mirabilis]|uniref:Glycoside hydrolase family 43 protein n=1 Tax=Recurvomyces mirabilis TaxID=574656 RepID=A0AAE0WU07_9PEZI|nr:hypothetical protein LTR78_002118 [Recurvomyces mirabilis]KAK5160576.1 hypothetical protein LTS14_001588 [Recurvomyces mirabilis]
MYSFLLSPIALIGITIALPQPYTSNTTNNAIRHRRATTAHPIMGGQNFPDPGIIRVADGWHAFSTNALYNGTPIHVQIAHTPDFMTWTLRASVDAMPKLAPWVDTLNPRVWAPDVVQLADGSFMMYYTAAYVRNTKLHCVSFATSKNVDGPYVDAKVEPWTCPVAQGGAIDPSGYLNADGTRWVVYKIDGNAIGHGGSCGNTVRPIVQTPIMLQQVAADGHSKIGNPIQLISNDLDDGPVVEAPALAYLDGKYVLFFSSNCFATSLYDVSYAIASDIRGPYRKGGPLYVTGNMGMYAPGGLDVALNGNRAIWHGNVAGGRAAFTGIASLDGNVISMTSVS